MALFLNVLAGAHASHRGAPEEVSPVDPTAGRDWTPSLNGHLQAALWPGGINHSQMCLPTAGKIHDAPDCPPHCEHSIRGDYRQHQAHHRHSDQEYTIKSRGRNFSVKLNHADAVLPSTSSRVSFLSTGNSLGAHIFCADGFKSKP